MALQAPPLPASSDRSIGSEGQMHGFVVRSARVTVSPSHRRWQPPPDHSSYHWETVLAPGGITTRSSVAVV